MGEHTAGKGYNTLDRFAAKKRLEVQTFCVTCRRGGFNEADCSSCDLYVLASDASGKDYRDAWCSSCDYIVRTDLENMLGCGAGEKIPRSTCPRRVKDGCIGCEYAKFHK